MSEMETRGPSLVTEGEWQGWKTWKHDAFETRAGPFYFRYDADGGPVAAFRAEERHMNGGGFMHGGCMLTFADFALFSIAHRELGESYAVTLNLSGDFLDPIGVGALVEARGEVTRGGGKTVFVRGLVTGDGKPALSFTGIVRKITRRN